MQHSLGVRTWRCEARLACENLAVYSMAWRDAWRSVQRLCTGDALVGCEKLAVRGKAFVPQPHGVQHGAVLERGSVCQDLAVVKLGVGCEKLAV